MIEINDNVIAQDIYNALTDNQRHILFDLIKEDMALDDLWVYLDCTENELPNEKQTQAIIDRYINMVNGDWFEVMGYSYESIMREGE